MPTALRTEPARGVPCLGNAQVQGVGDAAGDVSIGRHHGRHVEGLQGDLDEVEVHLFQDADLPEGGLHHALVHGGWYLTLGQGRQRRQAARVHPHSNGHPTLAGFPHHGPYLLRVADVAGVEAQAVYPGLEGGQGQTVIEVDVGDDGNGAGAQDLGQGGRRFPVGHGHPYQLASQLGQLPDLAQGGGRVGRVGAGHGLDDDGGIASHCDVPDLEGLRFPSLDHRKMLPP